jgi:hypothetical protein
LLPCPVAIVQPKPVRTADNGVLGSRRVQPFPYLGGGDGFVLPQFSQSLVVLFIPDHLHFLFPLRGITQSWGVTLQAVLRHIVAMTFGLGVLAPERYLLTAESDIPILRANVSEVICFPVRYWSRFIVGPVDLWT